LPIEALDFADRALDFADKTLDFADRALDFADIKKRHEKWRKHVNCFLFADKLLPICR
jgi:hypothetical protein